MSSPELSQRAALVLEQAIEVYLLNGAAVSSSQLAQKISGIEARAARPDPA